jgi:hypothetical protein
MHAAELKRLKAARNPDAVSKGKAWNVRFSDKTQCHWGFPLRHNVKSMLALLRPARREVCGEGSSPAQERPGLSEMAGRACEAKANDMVSSQGQASVESRALR